MLLDVQAIDRRIFGLALRRTRHGMNNLPSVCDRSWQSLRAIGPSKLGPYAFINYAFINHVSRAEQARPLRLHQPCIAGRASSAPSPSSTTRSSNHVSWAEPARPLRLIE